MDCSLSSKKTVNLHIDQECEFIRLAVSNRQQFPGLDWQSAPQLVSDYRVDRKKRVFPKRNKKISEIFSLSEIKNHKFFQDALKALLSNTEKYKNFRTFWFSS